MIDPAPDLHAIFQLLNHQYFAGALPLPLLRWNSRLRSAAGRFFPGAKRNHIDRRPIIEVATYLLENSEGLRHIEDTVAHEMIHYWLWANGRPFGHTKEFKRKLKEVGAPMYNPVPKLRQVKYVYQCPSCSKIFRARKKWETRACGFCCKRFNHGKFDKRFILVCIAQSPEDVEKVLKVSSEGLDSAGCSL